MSSQISTQNIAIIIIEMKQFNVPITYRSEILGSIKLFRKKKDPRKQDFQPTELNLGRTNFFLPRHFGFCYGVENAIEIAFQTIHENQGKRIFMLGEMIHNPLVNQDLHDAGVRFLVDNHGKRLFNFEQLTPEDIVIIPAFGTTVEIESELKSLGVELAKYNTTCPFVEKVWKRSNELGSRGYTLIIHGKYKHEETRATFSHAALAGPCLIIRNMTEAVFLSEVMTGVKEKSEFYRFFEGKFSEGFDVDRDLMRLGVVNQTTMLAEETSSIAQFLKDVVTRTRGNEAFADTRDTLCYATNDNQTATQNLLKCAAKTAFVVGGFNSSNTIQLATILSQEFEVFFIRSAEDIDDQATITHLNMTNMEPTQTQVDFKSEKFQSIVITSGASCPDSVMDAVILKICSFRNEERALHEAVEKLLA
jgi:4-hydroxy-3-methylbut-2-enyl diphosphate reductase